MFLKNSTVRFLRGSHGLNSGIMGMMEVVFSDKKQDVLRFDSDEDVALSLVKYVMEEKIGAAWVSAIGSAKEIELGFYDKFYKEYRRQVFNEEMEVVNLSGNVGILNKKPAVHLHGSFGLHDYRVVGGHVHSLIVNTTVEMYLDKMDGVLKRDYDGNTGLNLFKS